MLLRRCIASRSIEDLLAEKDKPLYSKYKLGIVEYGPDWEDEVTKEVRMISEGMTKFESGRPEEHIAAVNEETEEQLYPSSAFSSPSSRKGTEPKAAREKSQLMLLLIQMVWARWNPSTAGAGRANHGMLGGSVFGEKCNFRVYVLLLFSTAGFDVSGSAMRGRVRDH